ncbi:MAG: histidine phosphatase family protein [Prochloraceae cyanobacterium]|nr:histidine phosphatase family protein [Prochloraceae cyanobacterium]
MLAQLSRVLARIILGLALVVVLFAASSAPASAQQAEASQITTVLLVRHADRDNDDDFLNCQGKARAKELVQVVEKANVKAIFMTDTQRSQQTAEPLAQHLNLAPTSYEGLQELVSQILSQYNGQAVFVVGHSNTLPLIVQAFGGNSDNCQLSGNEYDNLCVISVYGSERANVINLQYGKPSS